MHDRVKLAQDLIDKGVPISKGQDTKDGTPLHLAAKLLLDRGAVISATDIDGHTAIHHAAFDHQNDIILQLLIDAGGDISYQTGQPPLIAALTGIDQYDDEPRRGVKEAEETVRILLLVGADLMDGGEFRSPLDVAIAVNDFSAASLLLGAGAYLEDKHDIVVDDIMQENNVPFIDLLVTLGVYSEPMFEAAAANASISTFRHIMHAYPPSQWNDDIKNRALEGAAFEGRLEMSKFLISLGAKPVSGGIPSLEQWVASPDYQELMMLLLNAGAVSGDTGFFCSDAIRFAAQIRWKDVLQSLLDAGADATVVHRRSRRNALFGLSDPYIQAREMEEEEVLFFAEKLLNHEVDINARDSKGKTVLDVVYDLGNYSEDTIDFLKSRGAIEGRVLGDA
ncbi:hypothetical protein AJ79_09305 [Helicocarpus griseus UAMH5409]|uniref:Peptidase A2 domain-containing protein n=1 Tax=Helicocarpus griseus UAMH5409 TaxID=1447875 RepID=A0A2B7WKU8_9EURO|nr:hypothetical protein AJ79_09305 [Helicocarpus griseus UAMH5409]